MNSPGQSSIFGIEHIFANQCNETIVQLICMGFEQNKKSLCLTVLHITLKIEDTSAEYSINVCMPLFKLMLIFITKLISPEQKNRGNV